MKRWSVEETEKLLDIYNKSTNVELEEAFPDRTQLSIYKKAIALGMYKDPAIAWQNRSYARKGDKASNWKGGKKISRKGYVLILQPGHHRADMHGYVMEHIVVFENETGIAVQPNCVVHHLNGNKQDNRIENLCLMSFSAHTTYHNNKRWGNNK